MQIVAMLGDWLHELPRGPFLSVLLALAVMAGILQVIGRNRQLRMRLAHFSRAVHQSPASIVITDRQGKIEYVNPTFSRVTGYTLDEVIGQNPRVLKSGEMPPEGYRQLWQTVCAGGEWRGEFHNRRKNGEMFWELAVISPLTDSAGRITHFLAVKEDITQRKALEEEMRNAAQLDGLTSLPNRATLYGRLERALVRRREENRHFAVLFLDFDRFKIINDSLGHKAGDLLLQEISKRLRQTLRDRDVVADPETPHTAARLGGDEFVVLLEGVGQPADALAVGQRLLEALSRPYHLAGHEVFSTASIGIVTTDIDHQTPDELLRDADVAMYEAKLAGKGRCILFDQAMRQRVQERIVLENDLGKAVEQEQFVLHYQPIIALDSGEVRGFEALLRWNHPQRGLVPPGVFIPLAEETGLIVPIERWVLEQAAAQLARWQSQGGPLADAVLNVNLSRKHLHQPDLAGTLRAIIARTGANPRRLCLELTESAIMQDATAAAQVLAEVRLLGIKLCMDDFGTGYSSLACLHQFPLDGLKIDRSFIANLDGGEDFTALVNAIVMLARNLGIEVVAEGVETMEQAALLQSLDVPRAQGYLFGRPMPVEQAEVFQPTLPNRQGSTRAA